MNLKYSELTENVKAINIKKSGDSFERENANFIQTSIPNYELFWKLFVFPFRMENSIAISYELSNAHTALCMYNYSIYRNLNLMSKYLGRASKNRREDIEIESEDFENFLIRESSIYDNLMHFLGAFYWTVRKTDRGDNFELSHWGENKHIQNPMKTWLLQYDQSLHDELKQLKSKVPKYRNLIVHGAKWPGYNDRVIKEARSDTKLIYWNNWMKLAKTDFLEFENRTEDRLVAMERRFARVIEKTNTVWELLLSIVYNDMMDEDVPSQGLIRSDVVSGNPSQLLENLEGEASGSTTSTTVWG